VEDTADVAGLTEAGDDRPAAAPRRREPPPARQSLVIPVVVPGSLVDAGLQEDVSAADPVSGQADLSDTQTPDSEVAVDLTAVADSDPVLQDGDSTVDLVLDPADLAEIRATQAGRSPGDDTPLGMG